MTIMNINEKKNAVINALTRGGFDFLSDTYKNTDIELGKAIKLGARITLPLTKSAHFDNLQSFALYTGELEYSNEEEGHKVTYADGFFRLNINVFKRYAKEHGIRIHGLKGVAAQARAVFIKGYGMAFAPKDIQLQIMAIVKKYKAEVIFVNYEDKNYTQLLKDIQLGKEYTLNKMYIFGTKSLQQVDIIVDMTTCKAMFDFSVNPELNVMEIVSEADGSTTTSSQMLAGIMGVKGAKEVFIEKAKATIDKVWDLSERPVVSINDVKSVDYSQNTIEKINLDYVLSDKKYAADLAKTKLQSSINKIAGYNFNIKGSYVKIIPDLGCDFNTPILNWGELFLGGRKARRYAGKNVEAIRYPKTAPSEHYTAKVIGYNEIKERIVNLFNNGSIDIRAARFLLDFFKNTKSGNAVVPSGNQRFMDVTGGSDFDGDSICVIFDEDLVDLYTKVPMGAIDFGKPPKSKKILKFDLDLLDNGYYAGISNGNSSVGECVNFAYSCLAIAQTLEAGQLSESDYETFIAWCWNNQKEIDMKAKMPQTEYGKNNMSMKKNYKIVDFFKTGDKYERMFTSSSDVIKEEQVDAFLAEAYRCGIGKMQNLINILYDCNKAYASVVGRTIDSTKNGALVHAALLWLRRYMTGGLIQKVSMNEEKDNSRALANWLGYSFDHIKTGIVVANEKGDLKFVANDVLAQVQNEMLDYMIEKAKAFVDLVEAKAGDNFPFISSLGLYKEIEASKYVAAISSGIAYGVPESVNKVKPYFTDMVRSMTQHLGYTQRMAIIKEASKLKSGDYSSFRGNFGVETVLDALKDNDFEVREELFSFDADYEFFDGQIINLVNGRNDDVYTIEKIDGQFIVEIDDDGIPYATTSVKEYAVANDKSTAKFALSVSALEDNQDLLGRLNNTFRHSQDGCKSNPEFGKCKFFVKPNEKGGSILIAKYENGTAVSVAKIVTPKMKNRNNNIVEKYINDKEIRIDYIESYQPKGKATEYVAIFGEIIG